MVTHPFGYHARPCLTLALKNMYSCSVPLTLLWFLLSRSRTTTVLTVLHDQVMIYTIKRCDPGSPLITRRKLLLLMLHDRHIDRGPFIIFSDSLFTEAYPWKGFHISYISVLILLPLMTSGQYSNHSVLLGDLCSGEKKVVCRRGWLAGAVVGVKEGALLWVWWHPWNEGANVLFLAGIRSSLSLCGEGMCCFCSQCGSRNIGIAGRGCFSFPSFCFWPRHLTHACMVSFTPLLNMIKFSGWLQWLFTCCWNLQQQQPFQKCIQRKYYTSSVLVSQLSHNK